MAVEVEGFTLTYVSDLPSLGGQHHNGPSYGIYRCEHAVTQTAVEVHSYPAHGPHKARELALTLCAMAVPTRTPPRPATPLHPPQQEQKHDTPQPRNPTN